MGVLEEAEGRVMAAVEEGAVVVLETEAETEADGV